MKQQEFISKEIGRTKVSQILPVLKQVACEWGLNLSKRKDFLLAKKILVNQAAFN